MLATKFQGGVYILEKSTAQIPLSCWPLSTATVLRVATSQTCTDGSRPTCNILNMSHLLGSMKYHQTRGPGNPESLTWEIGQKVTVEPILKTEPQYENKGQPIPNNLLVTALCSKYCEIIRNLHVSFLQRRLQEFKTTLKISPIHLIKQFEVPQITNVELKTVLISRNYILVKFISHKHFRFYLRVKRIKLVSNPWPECCIPVLWLSGPWVGEWRDRGCRLCAGGRIAGCSSHGRTRCPLQPHGTPPLPTGRRTGCCDSRNLGTCNNNHVATRNLRHRTQEHSINNLPPFQMLTQMNVLHEHPS